jgi:hypothetical protein
MHCTRLSAGPDGASHFTDMEVALSPVADYAHVAGGAPVLLVSAAVPTTAITFLAMPAGMDAGWHPVPRRQMFTVLSGSMEVTTSDGAIRHFAPGAVLVGEDTTGQGHRTRTRGDTPCVLLVTVLAPDPEPPRDA